MQKIHSALEYITDTLQAKEVVSKRRQPQQKRSPLTGKSLLLGRIASGGLAECEGDKRGAVFDSGSAKRGARGRASLSHRCSQIGRRRPSLSHFSLTGTAHCRHPHRPGGPRALRNSAAQLCSAL